MWKSKGLRLPIVVVMGALLNGAADPRAEQLQRHRNLGKAFYENPTTQKEAVTEFKAALDLAPAFVPDKLNYGLALLRAARADEGASVLQEVQRLDPSLPHTWFNLGIYYKNAGDLVKAAVQFAQFVKLVPGEPIGHYQLGAVDRADGRIPEAIAQFEQAEKLDPQLAAAHFQLYNLYRQSARQEEAAKQLQEFQRLKQEQEGAAIKEDVDWCNYAEIYDPPRQVSAIAPNPKPIYDDRTLEGIVDAATSGVLPIDSEGTGRTDLLIWSKLGVRLYRGGLQYAADSGLAGVRNVISVAAGDYDNDGLMDLCILTDAGPLLYHNLKGRFVLADAKLPQRRFDLAVWIDYDHDYDLDLVLLGESPALMRNQGSAGFADRTGDFPFVKGQARSAFKLRINPDSKAFDLAVEYANGTATLYRDLLGGKYAAEDFHQSAPPAQPVDFNNDGRPDAVSIEESGKVHVLLNRSPLASHWMRVQLTGIKSLKLAQDAVVEIKAGTLYRRQTYEGVPLLFDTGDSPIADVVRITWPNGLIQNETKQATNKAWRYEEAQRLSGSCPMIWTWNGSEFRFITDVLGVAPLGASDGEGTYFPVDHDEYVTIPAGALVAKDGRYEVRVTEELSEVSYLDQFELTAVDHPATDEIFTNEKFKGPPYPEFRLFGATRRIYPRSARDDRGRDVLPLLLTRDQRYPDQFSRTELGAAELHTLDLDFTGIEGSESVLLLNGWVDWPDGSTFRAAAQEQPGGFVMPYLQMQNAAGAWVTVNEDMGMPAGKPKTIAVPLKWISESRKVRIVTNLCVYWDEIFLSETAGAPKVHQSRVPMLSADLHFRGFSQTRIDPARKQPDTFLYGQLDTTSYWNPTPGRYTRYGDVRELALAVDDKLILMGSGDELRLVFDGSNLPALPEGWRREFLLKVDGWAKDRDANTAFSNSVEPLPFHAMSRYPYPAGEHYPDDEEHNRYRQEYNTRPALRLIRSLQKP